VALLARGKPHPAHLVGLGDADHPLVSDSPPCDEVTSDLEGA
jgi:hypothetical protein